MTEALREAKSEPMLPITWTFSACPMPASSRFLVSWVGWNSHKDFFFISSLLGWIWILSSVLKTSFASSLLTPPNVSLVRTRTGIRWIQITIQLEIDRKHPSRLRLGLGVQAAIQKWMDAICHLDGYHQPCNSTLSKHSFLFQDLQWIRLWWSTQNTRPLHRYNLHNTGIDCA